MWRWFKRDTINTKWRWAALITYIGMLTVNGLAGSTTILGGKNTAEVSDTYGNLFTPAGVTFAIWGAIYLLLGILFFRVFEIWNTASPQLPIKSLNRLLKLFTISSMLNVAWLFAWQYEVLGLSVLLMIGLLTTLGFAHCVVSRQKLSAAESIALRAPFSVYFGWITVATIANITAWLVSINWSGWGLSPITWTIIVLIAATIIGLGVATLRRDAVYVLVFAWAFFGILLQHMSSSGFGGQYPSIIVTVCILFAILLAASVLIGSLSLVLRSLSWKKLASILFT